MALRRRCTARRRGDSCARCGSSPALVNADYRASLHKVEAQERLFRGVLQTVQVAKVVRLHTQELAELLHPVAELLCMQLEEPQEQVRRLGREVRFRRL